MTNAEAWFNIALRPRKPEGSLGRTAQDGHLDSHTAPELWLGPILFLYCCFTSTEARWPIRDWDRVGRGRQSEGSTAETARKRPERPWTAARTMEVLRRCPLAIAQRLVHCAIAVSTAVLGQSHKDNVRCTAVDEQLGQLEAKEVQLAQPSSTSLLMISSGQT